MENGLFHLMSSIQESQNRMLAIFKFFKYVSNLQSIFSLKNRSEQGFQKTLNPLSGWGILICTFHVQYLLIVNTNCFWPKQIINLMSCYLLWHPKNEFNNAHLQKCFLLVKTKCEFHQKSVQLKLISMAEKRLNCQYKLYQKIVIHLVYMFLLKRLLVFLEILNS